MCGQEIFDEEVLPQLDSLVRRVLGMLHRFRAGEIPKANKQSGTTNLELLARQTSVKLIELSIQDDQSAFLAQLKNWLAQLDSTLQEQAPWQLYQKERKEHSPSHLLDTVLYDLLESLRLLAVVARYYDSSVANHVLRLLCDSIDTNKETANSLLSPNWGGLIPGAKARTAQSLIRGGKMESEAAQASEAKPETEEVVKKEEPVFATFNDFLKIDLRVAQIMEAERLEKSEKLIKLQIDLGQELGGQRQIVAGIAKHYSAEELVGRKIAVVANLKPAKLMGEVSQGMLLAASDASGNLNLVNPGESMPVGSKIS